MSLTERVEELMKEKQPSRFFNVRHLVGLYNGKYYDQARDALREVNTESKYGNNFHAIVNFLALSIDYHLALRLPSKKKALSSVWNRFDKETQRYISAINSNELEGFEEEARADIKDGKNYVALLGGVVDKKYVQKFSDRIDLMEMYLMGDMQAPNPSITKKVYALMQRVVKSLPRF